MKSTIYSVLISLVVVFVIASLAGLVDTLYNVWAGYYLTGGFLGAIDFYAHDTLANLFFGIAVAAVMGLGLLLCGLLRPGRLPAYEARWALIFCPAAVFLALLLVVIPVNFIALPNFFELTSLIANGLMLLTALVVLIPGVIFGRYVVKWVARKSVAWIALLFSVLSIAFIIAGLALNAPGAYLPRSRTIDGPNVIIITIDALRQDRVDAYGAGYVGTPNLDAFAERSVRFNRICTNSPWTLPSMYTMNCSRYPTVHGAEMYLKGRDEIVMLAEVLKSHGYETEAYVANNLLFSGIGFGCGFDKYVEYGDITPFISFKHTTVYRFFKRMRDTVLPYLKIVPLERRTEWITDKLVSTLSRKRTKPFFLWAHYLDPHTPLTPPREYMEGPEDIVEERLRFGFSETAKDDKLEKKDREALVALYEAEVRYVDDRLKRVFDVIEETGLYENSIIIITADHAEEFFEHGRYGHAKTHFDEVVSIPLMIYVPDGNPGVTDYPAALIDIMPTILDYVGADAPPGMSGESLMPVIRNPDGPFDEKFIFIDRTALNHDVKSCRLYPYTLIRSGVGEYDFRDNRIHKGPDDIVADPDEKLFESYRKALDDWVDRITVEAEALGSPAEIKIDAERRVKLKGLGYLK